MLALEVLVTVLAAGGGLCGLVGLLGLAATAVGWAGLAVVMILRARSTRSTSSRSIGPPLVIEGAALPLRPPRRKGQAGR